MLPRGHLSSTCMWWCGTFQLQWSLQVFRTVMQFLWWSYWVNGVGIVQLWRGDRACVLLWEGRWLRSACRGVLVQDTEPKNCSWCAAMIVCINYCKLLWTKASAKCPKCKLNNDLVYMCHNSAAEQWQTHNPRTVLLVWTLGLKPSGLLFHLEADGMQDGAIQMSCKELTACTFMKSHYRYCILTSCIGPNCQAFSCRCCWEINFMSCGLILWGCQVILSLHCQ